MPPRPHGVPLRVAARTTAPVSTRSAAAAASLCRRTWACNSYPPPPTPPQPPPARNPMCAIVSHPAQCPAGMCAMRCGRCVCVRARTRVLVFGVRVPLCVRTREHARMCPHSTSHSGARLNRAMHAVSRRTERSSCPVQSQRAMRTCAGEINIPPTGKAPQAPSHSSTDSTAEPEQPSNRAENAPVEKYKLTPQPKKRTGGKKQLRCTLL